MKKSFILITTLTCLMLFFNPILANALSSPPEIIDVEGTIYELDGVTPIWRSVNISLTNLNNSVEIKGITKDNSPSAFKISISGKTGDLGLLKVWNKEYENNKTLILTIIRNESITLNMNLQNYAPEFLSTPITTAIEDSEYEYQIITDDYNLDALNISLVDSPTTMILTSDPKLLWIPNQNDVDNGTEFNISVKISDGEFSVYQNFTINLTPINSPPIIHSYPKISAKEETLYEHSINATDEENDALNFTLTSGPPGMSMNPNGSIYWTPANGEKGVYHVSFIVSDGDLSISQEYLLFVGGVNNSDPEIASSPITTANINKEYIYKIDAIDLDLDYLMYELFDSGYGAYVTNDGTIHWTPTEDYVGLAQHFVARVVDVTGGSSFQEFYVSIGNDSTEDSSDSSSDSSNTKSVIAFSGGMIAGLQNPSNNTFEMIGYQTILGETEKLNNSSNAYKSIYKIDNSSSKTSFKNLEIIFYDNKSTDAIPSIYFKILENKPSKIESPKNLVFNYFDIAIDKTLISPEDMQLTFFIDNKLMDKSGINPEDIILVYYENNSWNAQELVILGNNGKETEFKSKISNFGLFAISTTKNNAYPNSSYAKQAPTYDTSNFINVSARIYKKYGFFQVDKMTRYKLTKLSTGESLTSFTGISDKKNSGSFIHVLNIKENETLDIVIYSSDSNKTFEKNITLSNQKMQNFKIYTDFPNNSELFIVLMLTLLMILIVVFLLAKFKWKKLKNSDNNSQTAETLKTPEESLDNNNKDL